MLRSIIAGASAGAVEIGMIPALHFAVRSNMSQPLPIPPNVNLPDVSEVLHTLTQNAVAKTRSQLNRHLPDGKKLPWPPFGKQWYAGCTTLIIGNSVKAGVRTLTMPLPRGTCRVLTTASRICCIRLLQGAPRGQGWKYFKNRERCGRLRRRCDGVTVGCHSLREHQDAAVRSLIHGDSPKSRCL